MPIRRRLGEANSPTLGFRIYHSTPGYYGLCHRGRTRRHIYSFSFANRCGAHIHPAAQSNADTVAGSHGDGYTEANRHTVADGYTKTNRHAGAHANGDANTGADADGDGDARTYARTGPTPPKRHG